MLFRNTLSSNIQLVGDYVIYNIRKYKKWHIAYLEVRLLLFTGTVVSFLSVKEESFFSKFGEA